jgi:uncharacterized membrane protein (GlpM family)
MDIKLLPIYFVIGGLTVSITTYFGSRGEGMLAAFAGLFPGITLITFCAIYIHSGSAAVTSYARGTLILLPAWVLYIVGVMYLMPRLGLAWTLAASVAVYLLVAFLILKLT